MRLTHQLLKEVLNGPLTHAQQQGRLDETDIAQWWRPLDEAEARGQFLATHLTFIVIGTVPA
jgi:hypothetical protein